AGKVANEQKILADSSARVAAEQRDIARIEKLKADSSAILAFEQKQLAEQKSREAEINLGIAKREEARALVALEQVKKEKSATEEQRRRAEDNYRIAQEKTVEVEKQAEVVKRALEATKTALRNVVSLTLTEVERLIYEIKYDSAFNRISTVISLDASKPEVSNALLEFAFWYCESGKLEKSADIIKKAYSLADKPMATYPGQIDIKLLRDLIHNLNPERDSMLFDRYYPQMVDVQGGTFDMGTKSGIEEKRKIKLNPFAKREVNPYANEEPVHKVSLSDFRICKTEITWWQYALFCEAKERNYLTPGWGADGDNPVVNVSWYDAVEYANWLSEQMGLNPAYDIDRDKEDINNNSVFDNLKWSVKLKDDSNGYRLPTESEWEYAARGGNKSKGRIYAGSNDLDSVGWYYADSGSRTRAVGQKKPNELGLYDMSGNVWEWCWDWYGDYKSEPQENPVGAEKGGSRVYRGGGWYYGPRVWRAAIRGDGGPSNGYNNLGFRLAVSLQ
ncbi:MAG: SUMF1/EgtB/PvdO family nonheme iron enzyme, partial [Saprospiraceae bacterium]|nr:SUMF1/EgtB/PvdO family nonheme iron enzyme [Saprospiraceae bacterium]